MGIEGRKGIPSTNVSLTEGPSKAPETLGVLEGFTPEELKELEGGAFNQVQGGWTHNLNHPVFVDMPDELVAILHAAAADSSRARDAARALEKRWEVLLDAGVDV